MNIGIYDINTGNSLNYKERLDIYKKVGFTELAIYLDNNYMENNENYVDIINYAHTIGLSIKQVHLDYKISNLICDKNNGEYFEYLESKIKECIKYNIPSLIVHASKGNEPPLIDNDCLEKLKNIANKYPNNITICFENVRVNTNLDKILALNISNVRMCYDLGHAHCYDNEYDLLNKYLKNISCVHLHNNTGSDSHNRLSVGDIDYKKILKTLENITTISVCLECFPPRNSILNKEEFEKFLLDCYSDIR